MSDIPSANPTAGVENTTETSAVTIETRNAAGTVILNRPKALNALNDAMRAEIAATLPGFANDPIVYAMVIRAVPARAFCAGGDVRELVETARVDLAAAKASFAAEYLLDWALECFPKPTVSLIDGLVVGSGVGLTLFGTHRVAGDGYRFAMPEAAIGLFPDVGVCHHLARLPHEIGTYLALTGATIGRDDAFALGLVTHCVDAGAFDHIHNQLSQAEPVDALLDHHHRPPGPSELMARGPLISQLFAGNSVAEILTRLERSSVSADAADAAWCAAALEQLRAHAPTSLAITLRHIREAAGRDIRAVLVADYRLACGCLEHGDFAEGVRAMLIDKDKQPRWRPASVAELDPAALERFFEMPEGGDLVLPNRAAMQRLRAL